MIVTQAHSRKQRASGSGYRRSSLFRGSRFLRLGALTCHLEWLSSLQAQKLRLSSKHEQYGWRTERDGRLTIEFRHFLVRVHATIFEYLL